MDYYIRVADYILPHLRDRPVTLKRYPNGVRGQHFYEKDAPAFTPGWVKTFPVPVEIKANPIFDTSSSMIAPPWFGSPTSPIWKFIHSFIVFRISTVRRWSSLIAIRRRCRYIYVRSCGTALTGSPCGFASEIFSESFGIQGNSGIRSSEFESPTKPLRLLRNRSRICLHNSTQD